MKFGERADLLLEPLTPDQREQVREAFNAKGRPKDAEVFLSEWTRIAETAHQLALKRDMTRSYLNLFRDKRVRARRDKQLKQVISACAQATGAIDVMRKIVPKHNYSSRTEQFPGFEAGAKDAKAFVVNLAVAVMQLRSRLREYQPAPASMGEARWVVDGAVFDVLAAYFKHRGWQIVRSNAGLFAEVLFAVCVEPRGSVNSTKFRRAADLQLSYPALESEAPRDVEFVYPAEYRAQLRRKLASRSTANGSANVCQRRSTVSLET